jgi:hypothetical protein
VTSHPPGQRGRALIPLLIVMFGILLGAGGLLLLHPSGTPGMSQPPRLTGPVADERDML